jgi:choline dehydrogenase-like flavoprotein
MSAPPADVVVVGAGVAGLLVARELVSSGREVLVLERGGLKPHPRQLEEDDHAAALSTAAHNHEPHPDTPANPWGYEYGVGGTTLHWGGNTPRMLPADFELRSRYGVGRDWPIGYAELRPFYEEAERALAVAGGPNPLFGAGYRPPLPAHPLAPVDRLIAPHLEPYASMPQARPTASVGGRPACCGSGRCGLCPVDARYSALHTLGDHLTGRRGFRLRYGVIVARIRAARGGWRLQCVSAQGPYEQPAATTVLAANGIENAAILLRSDLGGPEVGRWLADHQHLQYRIELDRDAGAGRGASIVTGVSYAWADGDWRRERGSQLVYPDNRGAYMGGMLVEAIAAGRRGRQLRRSMRDVFERTVVIETLGEDLPHPGRRVELSPRRDRFGLPLNRLRYPADSPYLEASRRRLGEELVRRLRPLGARLVATRPYRGGHQLGTVQMGEGGPIDADGRLRGAERLFVVGGSSFPSYSAAHPTLTIAALAIRLGRLLAGSQRADSA